MQMPRRTFLARAAAAGACVVASGIASSRFATAAADVSVPPEEPSQERMRTRKIPSTDEALPVIGLGTWNALNPPQVNDQTLAPLAEVLQAFFDAGGRVVDTAPSYGSAEEVTGLLSQRMRINDQLFLATKVHVQGRDSGIESYKKSLQRLRRQRIELMQVHNLVDWTTHLTTLREWKQAGTFRYLGVTHYQNHAHEELEKIVGRDKPDFLQVNYSVAEPQAGERLLPAARDAGVAVLINRPFAGGEIFARVREKPPRFCTRVCRHLGAGVSQVHPGPRGSHVRFAGHR